MKNNNMENSYKSLLKKHISDSSLNKNQKLLWDLFLKISNNDEDEAVYEAAIENESNLMLLTEHLRDKIWDMKENNIETWQAIVENEEKYAEIL